jgi:Alpha-2-macroglobulin bait region domain
MGFAEAKAQPGHETYVNVMADTKSICAVGVVDKSVELMGKSTWLTSDKAGIMLHRKSH